MSETNIKQDGNHISGVFTLLWPTLAKSHDNSSYYRAKLKDDSQEFRAYIWRDRCVIPSGQLVHGDKYHISGCLKENYDTVFIKVFTVEPLIPIAKDLFLPRGLCPTSGVMDRLNIMISQISIDPLLQFLQDVLRNEALVRDLLTCPASLGYHHNYSGGLIEHCIECAESIANEPNLSNEERQLAIVAALFHDIGKTRFFSGKLTFKGVSPNNHDSFTLYLLAQQIQQLEKVWQDGAEFLIYLWDWLRSGRTGFPVISAALALKKADELSCSQYNARQAFTNQPTWKRLSVKNGQKYFRLRQCD